MCELPNWSRTLSFCKNSTTLCWQVCTTRSRVSRTETEVCVCLLNSFRCFNKNYFLSRTPVPIGVCEGFLAKFWILIFSWRWYKAQSMWLFIYIFQKYNLNLSQIFFSLKNLYKYTYLNILQIYSSPKPFNITPLQVEILEKEMADLKLQLQETESRNLYLSAIVDEQKKYVLYFLWSKYLR